MKPRLSVVLVSYDMARELPRTVRSLSPAMQRGIASDDYEVIVVDNGSPEPPDEDALRECIPDIRIHHQAGSSPSPVAAVNSGLSLARGDLVGVFIDGARMASPGLLAAALEAARFGPRPVVGTIAFELGPDHQFRSVRSGYDQEAEDALLDASGWEEDGYRLFGISTLTKSSSAGWFTLPAESNALFLVTDHWRDLGGYDPAFTSPGGGLANHDVWIRACATAAQPVNMLLGEATFHQLHGDLGAKGSNRSFYTEYERIRGRPWERPVGRPRLVGTVHGGMLDSLNASVKSMRRRDTDRVD